MVLGMLAVVLEDADCSGDGGVAGIPANAGKWTMPLMSVCVCVAVMSSRSWGSLLRLIEVGGGKRVVQH